MVLPYLARKTRWQKGFLRQRGRRKATSEDDWGTYRELELEPNVGFTVEILEDTGSLIRVWTPSNEYTLDTSNHVGMKFFKVILTIKGERDG